MHPCLAAHLLQVDRVHVGGSFGRRTSVRRRFDVDLWVFVNGLDTSDSRTVNGLLASVSCHTAVVWNGGGDRLYVHICILKALLAVPYVTPAVEAKARQSCWKRGSSARGAGSLPVVTRHGTQ